MSRRAKAAAVFAVVLLAYALAGFYLVPRLARTQIEAAVAETLQRKISIGEIRFNPFTLAADIADLKLTEADGTPLIAFRRLHVNAELAASLWHRGVVLKEIDLTAPDIEVIIAPDGGLNLARLAPPAAPAQQAKQADEQPVRVHIGRLAVAEGRIGFQDRSLAQPFGTAFTPIRFSLTDFRTDVGHRNAHSFSATSPIGARFEWAGGFTVQPLGAGGTFTVSDLRLAALNEYLEGKVPAEIVSGNAQLRGEYRFDLQPLSLEIVLPLIGVRDLVLAERGVAGTPPITVPEIDAEQLRFSLTQRDVGLRRLSLRRARVEVARDADGSLNLARLFTPTAPQAEPTPAAPAAPAVAPAGGAAKSWTVHADAAILEGATVVAEDRTLSPPARVSHSPVDVTISDWSTAAGSRMKFETKIGIEKHGQLAVGGNLRLEPFDLNLAVDLQRFPLPVLQPYLSQATALALHSGELSAKGAYALAAPRPGASLASKVSGEARVDNLRASDDVVKEDLLRWRALVFAGIRFEQGPNRLRIDSVLAQEPYARIVIAQNGTTNIGRVLESRNGAGAPATAGAAKPAGERMPITIRTVRMAGGSAHFADYAIQPSFATGIVELNGQVTGLSSAPQSRAKVALSGKVDEFSPVGVSGEVNLLSATTYTDLAVSFRNMELTTFNPYSGKFAGYNISRGKLTTEMKYRVDDRKLDARHHIVVDGLEFGEQTDSKDAAPIPIKLGVALLKDKNGIIDLDLPVSGTLDDPEFRLAPIIWKALVNLLGKIVAAPFKALGALFGGGEELAFVDFEPASPALREPDRGKLGTLSKALVERPQLRLNVPFTVAPAADASAAAAQALNALVPPAAGPLDDAAKRKRIQALEAAHRAQLKTEAKIAAEDLDVRIDRLQAALLEHLKPPPAALEELARQRAQAVRAALLANKELSPDRVFMVSKPGEPALADGRVRMEMKLE